MQPAPRMIAPAVTDKYRPVSWAYSVQMIGRFPEFPRRLPIPLSPIAGIPFAKRNTQISATANTDVQGCDQKDNFIAVSLN